MTHTPGPWRPVGDAMKVFAGNMTICDIRGWGHLTGVGGLGLSDEDARDVQHANTRLIVAAPDLLATLKAVWLLLPSVANHDVEQRLRELIEAAIEKAEGTRG